MEVVLCEYNKLEKREFKGQRDGPAWRSPEKTT